MFIYNIYVTICRYRYTPNAHIEWMIMNYEELQLKEGRVRILEKQQVQE